jgi:ABC-type polysaccharide/polyol phosphate export permease
MKELKLSLQPNYYDSSQRGFLAFEELRGVIKYRELIGQLIKRELISRYKRSVLGVAWSMLNPLGTMLILTLVFSNIFHAIEGYPIYILSGLIAWNFFSQTTSASLSQNVWGGSLLHKIYLPRTAFTVSALGTGLVNFFISIVPLILIMFLLKFSFHLSMFFVPVSILVLAIFSLGLGLLFSTLAIYFPDVVEMYSVALTAWMYLTPIIYPINIIPAGLKYWVTTINPMFYFIELIRQPIFEGVVPSLQFLLTGSVIALVTFCLGWTIFTWKANELTYRT